MGQNATLKKCIEFVFDKVGQPRSGFSLNLRKEIFGVFLHQLIQDGLFWSPSFIDSGGDFQPPRAALIGAGFFDWIGNEASLST